MDKGQETKIAQALSNHEDRLKKLEEASLRESSPVSSGVDAQLKEEQGRSAQLAEQVTLLEQETAALKERSDALALLEELVKTPEGFVQMASKFGYSTLIPSAPDETAKANKAAAVAGEGTGKVAKPISVLGKVDDPDYLYLPGMGISLLKGAEIKED